MKPEMKVRTETKTQPNRELPFTLKKNYKIGKTKRQVKQERRGTNGKIEEEL